MEEDHYSSPQQAPLPDQAQFIEQGVPLVISIDKDTVIGVLQTREGIKAVALFDRDSCVFSVLECKVGIEAGVNDCTGDIWQLQDFICGEAKTRSYLAKPLPTTFSRQRYDRTSRKLLHLGSP
jgi:hypothetical protein